jgi:hypothetical protein
MLVLTLSKLNFLYKRGPLSSHHSLRLFPLFYLLLQTRSDFLRCPLAIYPQFRSFLTLILNHAVSFCDLFYWLGDVYSSCS